MTWKVLGGKLSGHRGGGPQVLGQALVLFTAEPIRNTTKTPSTQTPFCFFAMKWKVLGGKLRRAPRETGWEVLVLFTAKKFPRCARQNLRAARALILWGFKKSFKKAVGGGACGGAVSSFMFRMCLRSYIGDVCPFFATEISDTELKIKSETCWLAGGWWQGHHLATRSRFAAATNQANKKKHLPSKNLKRLNKKIQTFFLRRV